MEQKIVAILKKKRLKTFWGFVFNTHIQMHVERFMQNIHVDANEYVLYMDNEKPKGVYTEVSVYPIHDSDGKVIDCEFRLR